MKTFLVFLLSAMSASAALIDPTRTIPWGDYVGIPGGIPIRTNVFAVVGAPYNDGVTDATSAINSAANAATTNTVVMLTNGTYKITGTIHLQDGVTLRGQGMTNTILLASTGIGAQGVISITTGTAYIDTQSVTSGYTRGSSNIVVASAALEDIGQHIRIDQLNDTNYVNVNGLEGPGSNPARDYVRAVAQLVVITGKSGNTLTFWPPLVWTFSASLQPQIYVEAHNPNWSFIREAGVESLSIRSADNFTQVGINMTKAAKCWVKDVEFRNILNKNIDVVSSIFCVVRGCSFLNSVTAGQGAGYGVDLDVKSCFNLVEDNIGDAIGNTVIFEYSSMGNVSAYNFSHNSVYSEVTWLQGDEVVHALHPSFNLFESNKGLFFSADFIHGSASHNTIYRCYFSGHDEPATTSQLRAIELDSWHHYYNVVGCILGDPSVTTTANGWIYRASGAPNDFTTKEIWRLGYQDDIHLALTGFDTNVLATLFECSNYDFVTGSVLPSACTNALPDSLYLTARPSWYGTNLFFPAIIPTQPTSRTNLIPAEARWLGLTNTLPPPPPVLTNGTLTLLSTIYSISETNTPVTLEFQRLGGKDGAQTLTYYTTNVTAIAGTNYVAVNGTVTWADQDNSVKSRTVDILNSHMTNASRYFMVGITNAVGGAVLGPRTNATVTITAEVVPPPGVTNGVLEFSFPTSMSTLITDTPFSVQLKRTGAFTGAVSVTLSTANGTALAGVDFTNLTQVVNWANGDGAVKTVAVGIIDTHKIPNPVGSLYFFLTLSSPTGGATLGSVTNAPVTLLSPTSQQRRSVITNGRMTNAVIH